MCAGHKMLPKISVVMNCYNGEKYLKDAIESVILQSYSNWEIIFWDNKSIDNSRVLVESFNDDRIKYYCAQEHCSLGTARKMAMQRANGEWVGFLDVDDLWLPDKLEKQVKIIISASDDLGLVYGRTVLFGDHLLSLAQKNSHEFDRLPEGNIYKKLLYHNNFIFFTSALVSKRAYKVVGGFSETYKYCPDYRLFITIAKLYQVRAVQDVVAKYRIHTSNLTKQLGDIPYNEMVRVKQELAAQDPSVRIGVAWSLFVSRLKRILRERFSRFFNACKGGMIIWKRISRSR